MDEYSDKNFNGTFIYVFVRANQTILSTISCYLYLLVRSHVSSNTTLQFVVGVNSDNTCFVIPQIPDKINNCYQCNYNLLTSIKQVF